MIKNAIVEIRWDQAKRKLRAWYKGSWIRFPNFLRLEGQKFVCNLIDKGNFYIAVGDIKIYEGV